MTPFNNSNIINPDDEETPPRAPLFTAPRIGVIAILGGVALGLGVSVIKTILPGDADPEVAVDGATPVETTVAVAPAEAQAEPAALLLQAQETVRTLETQLAEREDQLARVAVAAGVRPEDLATRDLAVEVATTRANLDAARKVRDRLKTDLREALAEVEAQSQAAVYARAETAEWKEHAAGWKQESVRSQWNALEAEAKSEVCDHGTRKRVDKCQANLDTYFTEARFERYADCIHSGGLRPELWVTPRGQSVPAMAESIGSSGFLQREDWFVLYCDPNLPERADTDEGPGTARRASFD